MVSLKGSGCKLGVGVMGALLGLLLQAELPIGRSIALAQKSGSEKTVYRNITIQAFKWYREEKETIESFSDTPYSEQLALRLKTIELKPYKGVAPELTAFFEELKAEWRKSIQVYKQFEREDANLANSLSRLPQSRDALENTVMDTFFTRPFSQGAQAGLLVRWMPQLYQIDRQHAPTQMRLLSQLSQRYDYPFFEEVFGKVPPRDSSCRSQAMNQQVKVDGTSDQPIVAMQVCRGDHISFLALGLVRVGPYLGSTSPLGMPDVSAAYNKVRNVPHGALLVKVGDGNWRYGGVQNDFFAESSGPIYFMVNDRQTSNNGGAFVVDVNVEPISSILGSR